MLKLHEATKENMERINAKYKISGDKGRKQLDFAPGDLVWLHLRKEQFPDLRKSKLMPRADGPFKVLEKINENAYKLDLPVDFGVSPTFSIADLKPYLEEDDEIESRMTQIQEGEEDVDINTSDTSTPTHNQISGPITHAHARQLNNQVSSFLASYSYYLDNKNVCSILLLMNEGQEGNRVAFASVTSGFQNSSSLWRSPRPRMDFDLGMQILSRKLLESTFICIKPQVHIVLKPTTIVILVQRPFSVNGVAIPYFGPLGRVSCWVQFRCILGLEHDPASLRSSSHTYKT
jgi:hypothetical protein